MATNAELEGLFGNGDLINRVQASLAKVVYEISTGGDDGAPYDQAAGAHDKRVVWAASILSNPQGRAKAVLILVLGGNSTATVAQITGATDSALDTNVREVVDALAIAYEATLTTV